MRKTLFFSILAFGVAMGVSAQERVVNNPDNKGYFGVRLSVDAPIPGNVNYTDFEDHVKISEKPYGTGAGFTVGAIYNLPLVANLYFEPGLSFYYNAVSIKEGQLREEIDQLDRAGVKLTNHSVRQSGMKIPLIFGYHFDFTKDFNLAVFTGPVLDLGFSMDAYIKFKYEGNAYRVAESLYKAEDSDRDDRMNRFNADWRVGVGVNYKNFFASFSGDIRMTNMYHVAENNRKYYDASYRQNLFQFTLGYNFK